MPTIGAPYNKPMTTAVDAPRTSPEASAQTRPQASVPWNVVLLDDDHHSYDYVIDMMRRLFRLSADDALRVATSVDKQKRAICMTTHKEHAELKRDQILGFGRDPRIAACVGSMSAIIEPAHEPDDDRSST